MMIIALITNRNNPMVIIVAGSVINTRTGLKNIFSNPITTATHKAEVHPATCTPGNSQQRKTTKAVVTNNRTIKLIYFIFNFVKLRLALDKQQGLQEEYLLYSVY